MLQSLTILLACQLAGEVLVRLLHLPIPGPVCGMVILFIGLCWLGRVPAALARTADGMLANISLLFVPAGVGVMLHFDLIAADWAAIAAGIAISTTVGLILTALPMHLLRRRHTAGKTKPDLSGEA